MHAQARADTLSCNIILFSSTNSKRACKNKMCSNAMYIFELCATSSNICANAFMMIQTCKYPGNPVPIRVICVQITANVCWIVYAIQIQDVYLLCTALTSATLQCFTVKFLSRRQTTKSKIPLSVSDESLPDSTLLKGASNCSS